jgi:hypothetical protein
MPLKPIDYSKGIQYKIVCLDSSITDCYNGSTCSFKDRKGVHKKRCTNPNDKYYNLKVYRFIRENGGWDNWSMVQLEEYPCKSKQELLARERHWFDIIKPTMNSNSPTFDVEKMKKRSAKYAATHTEEIKERTAKYAATHKEERQKSWTEYNNTHTEEQKKWREDHKEELKEYFEEYYEQNKVKLAAKMKEYRAAHKDAISARKKEKVNCECGCEVTKSDLPRHQRTQKHLAIMAQKQ